MSGARFLVFLTFGVLWRASSGAASRPECSPTTVLSLSAVTQDGSFSLSNGFICLQVDAGKITSIAADHSGKGLYRNNVLAAGGVQLEREDEDGTVHSSGDAAAGAVNVTVLLESDEMVSIRMSGVRDSTTGDGVAEETWLFRMARKSRSFTFRRRGFAKAKSPAFRAIRRQWTFVI